MEKFTDKTVFITGAGGGIGKAIALAFAKKGANIALVDVKKEYVDSLAEEIQSLGSKALALAVDVTDYQSVKDAVGKTVATFGTLDIAVNNAGVVGIGSIEEIDGQEWDRVLSVNAKGVFICTKAVLEAMKPQKSGAIINTASIAGKIGMAHLSHYVASKFAVIGFTNSIAKEVAETGITVNAICPGIIGTGMWRGEGGIADRWKQPGETEAQSWERNKKSLIPQGTDQSAEDIADAVLFIASAPHITGQAIAVDGGMTM
ncbi:SDR family NAD(P)-dependent oxidoreductase [Flavobacterium johnsoniae]|uniref:Meso-butanediol dehydrogenase / (S,S)-butanediol dehydrogenase / diacetyl reductase n=1 Tax=Flavobacterium johnsoniae TaxID=986 RepID=A0A1M5UR78_FLAJO|nr:SDR family NAD(P)-dependent oxidoreductase [Flavobacterium johnsoniae]SHH65424.1 meso-butanediol dehydrogenase / (S,S)-butanediol dehydrogenase / diacetyl reductase [Flavobacterium johnsoniae]